MPSGTADFTVRIVNDEGEADALVVVIGGAAIFSAEEGLSVGGATGSDADPFFVNDIGDAFTGNLVVRGSTVLNGPVEIAGDLVFPNTLDRQDQAPAYTASNVTSDRSYNANATTTDELADVLGIVSTIGRQGATIDQLEAQLSQAQQEIQRLKAEAAKAAESETPTEERSNIPSEEGT